MVWHVKVGDLGEFHFFVEQPYDFDFVCLGIRLLELGGFGC